MASLPRVISPIETLFERDGVSVALVSVELWPQRVIIRLAGLPGEADEERARQHEQTLEQWSRATRPGAKPHPLPVAPGEELLLGLNVRIEDDVDTEFTLRSAQAGGTGSEWRGDWFFLGGPPDKARHLNVHITTPEGDGRTLTFSLAE